MKRRYGLTLLSGIFLLGIPRLVLALAPRGGVGDKSLTPEEQAAAERLWRSVKYEEVYLNDYGTVGDARTGLSRYFPFYNGERLHEALAYQTPSAVYWQPSLAGGLPC